MQIKQISRLFLLLFIVCLFATCKKYPEGPLISLRSRENRVAGNWNIQKYLVDGVDSTTSKYAPDCIIGFGKKTGAGYSKLVTNHCEMTGGLWDFTDNHESIVVTTGDTTKSSFFLSDATTWRIFKLKYQEMHLQTEFNSRKYDIYFSKSQK